MNEQSFAKELLSAMKMANKRQHVIILVLILSLVVSNAYWVWYNAQWEYEESITYEVDTQNDGGNAIINTGEGDVDYGESESEEDTDKAETKEVIESVD